MSFCVSRVGNISCYDTLYTAIHPRAVYNTHADAFQWTAGICCSPLSRGVLIRRDCCAARQFDMPPSLVSLILYTAVGSVSS